MRLDSFRMVGCGSNRDDPSALNEGPEFLPKDDVRSTSEKCQNRSFALCLSVTPLGPTISSAAQPWANDHASTSPFRIA
jgi:hypothetical protein